MYIRISAIAVLAATLATGACSQGPDLNKVRDEVTKAQADGAKKVADAKANFDKINAEVNKDVTDAKVDTREKTDQDAGKDIAKARVDGSEKLADARYEIDKAKADASYNVALAQCEGQSGVANKSCKETAKATYDSTVAAAKAARDAMHKSAQVSG
jgi:hypothetical protein